MLVVFHFFGRRVDGLDFSLDDDVRKILVHRGEGGSGRHIFQAHDEQIFHETRGMKIPVESRDDFYGFIRVVGDLVKTQIGRRNQFRAQELFADVDVKSLPENPAGFVHEHEGHELRFAGLHERERLETLVERAKAAGK